MPGAESVLRRVDSNDDWCRHGIGQEGKDPCKKWNESLKGVNQAVDLRDGQAASEPSPALDGQTVPANLEAFRSRLLLAEQAMASFLSPGVLRSHETTQD